MELTGNNLVLGIETSCDETAAAIVSAERRVLSDIVLSQTQEHRAYGGVVPEIAARAHVEHLDHLIAQALDKAGIRLSDLGGIAATAGPGLIGGVMVGLVSGKTLALATGKPFIAVNHLEGHALTARLIDDAAFPYLLLLVSGGHCQLISVNDVGDYDVLGTTIDDAVGEAFDKAAKMMGLGYPGGPVIEKAAAQGDPARFDFPRPLITQENTDFSFSGLKTAVRRALEKLGRDFRPDRDGPDIAASFQAAVGDVLCDRSRRAMTRFRDRHGDGLAHPLFVIAGGVAANLYLRQRLQRECESNGFSMLAPPPALCTDNAAMIAWAGIERLRRGQCDPLSAKARARWPLDDLKPPAS